MQKKEIFQKVVFLLIFLGSTVFLFMVGFFVVHNGFFRAAKDWDNLKNEIRSDCKEKPFFGDKYEKIEYLSELFSRFECVQYKESVGFVCDEMKDLSNGEKYVYYTTVDKNYDSCEVNKYPCCYVVWIGDVDGKGNVVYERNSGEIVDEKVKFFPYQQH